MVWRLQLNLSDHLLTQGNHLSSYFSYQLCSCMYKTELTNVAKNVVKTVKAKMLEAIVEHNVPV